MAVALLTGANTGVGLALAQRLVEENQHDDVHTITICLGCRNIPKALEAKESLLQKFPKAKVDILKIDVGNVQSVVAAAKEFRERYTRLDMLYLNAGIMPSSGIDWAAVFKPSISHFVRLFTTGGQVMCQTDSPTPEGLQNVFATNVFGHFLLIEELRGLMVQTVEQSAIKEKSGIVVFTSSRAAQPLSLDLEDLQHARGRDPYGSSKRAVDLLCLGLNKNSGPLRFYSACPGLVLSQLTAPLLPFWLWRLLTPILWLLRLFTTGLALTAWNGSEVLAYLQRPGEHDVHFKYMASCSVLGRPYVQQIPIQDSQNQADRLLASLRELARSVQHNSV